MFVREMGTVWEEWLRPGKQPPALTPSGQQGLVCVSLSRCPGGSHCLSSKAGWPVVANENTRHPVKFEFQINIEFF